MKIISLFFILFSSLFSFSQEKKLSIEINYGASFSPRVIRYTETPTPNALPEGIVRLANKDFLGTVSQIQANYLLKNNTSLSLGYARDNHQKERSYNNVINGVPISIDNWAIRHNNNIFFAKHKRNLKNNFKYHLGVFVLHPEQQEIDIYEPPIWNGRIEFDERDRPNNSLADGGFLGGIDYEKQIDTKFIAGLHLTGYHLTSASTYETTYLTGSIAYTFK